MAPRDELAPQRNRREGVAGIAERGQEDPPPWPLIATAAGPPARDLRAGCLRSVQSTSASVRSIARRPSMSGAIGVVISVPTPASR